MSDHHEEESDRRKKEGRVVYDNPSYADPRYSPHWQRLEGDHAGGPSFDTHDQLVGAFRRDVDSIGRNSDRENFLQVAAWSCITGYCEALATHADASRRRVPFPVPSASLRRLVDEEFLPLLERARDEAGGGDGLARESAHRRVARAVANAVWGRAQNKSSSVRDELHANSLYVCLRGDVDNKSLDCFGAALLVVVGMNILGFGSSCLTLSEDHAYESHTGSGDGDAKDDRQSPGRRHTCEVAVPGHTKAAQSKRAKEISYTFEQLKRDHITADTSWLYMAKNPVLCDTPGMVMAALVSNLNCDVDKQRTGAVGGRPHVVSEPLYRLKRDMLWVLHEAGHTARFPFALMELGECEEHLSSKKGMEWVDASESLSSDGALVLRNEKLFLDAISISRSVYGDAQVYPYLYAGHYHKDAGRDGRDQEYRLVESLRLYAEAARVASTYRYDAKDCLQLMKHMTTVASLISKDILLSPRTKDCRAWQRRENAVAAATWLASFYDSLLLWEEREQSSFVEILSLPHKHGVGKMFQVFSPDVRAEAVAKIHSHGEDGYARSAVTESRLIYFRKPQSRRFAEGSLLAAALTRGKVLVRELEMALPSNGEGRSARRRKRPRV